jgi:AcrR family transcriptional regulator
VQPRKQREADAKSISRKPDAVRSREDILSVARQEFSENGLSGARVDAIAARIQTTKRMIYYYFGSKEGLYLAVLEQVYSDIRSVEQDLDLASLTPIDAVRRMIEFTFDYEEAHPDFIRLVNIENIHHGRHIAQSDKLLNQNAAMLATLTVILKRGQREGAFRSDVDAVDLHLMISAFCFFRVSNRHTFGTLFRLDLTAPEQRRKHKRMICDAIIRMLEPRGSQTKPAPLRTGRPRIR